MVLGDLINSAGQAVQDLFSGEGATAEANSYTTAAQLAEQNASLSATSTRIQSTQTARQILQTEGTQVADVAGAGFTESGSALDLLRSSASQGALQQSLTNIQGAINENAYAAQAGAYKGAAAAANENATANQIGAISAIGGALVNNSQSLVSAGKTVVSGISDAYDSLFGSSATTAATQFTGAAAASDAENVSSFLGPASDSIGAQIYNPSVLGSTLDQSIAGGADFSQSIASSGIGVDTSGLDIGTDLMTADTGISDFIGSVSDSVASGVSDIADFASDAIPGLGWITGGASLLNMIPGWSSIPVLGDVTTGINDAVGAVTGAVGDAVDAVGNALGDVGSAIGGALGSVICTAYYRNGFIRYRTWLACQHYGAMCEPVIFKGYQFWGKPIAHKIIRHRALAFLLFPIFRSTIYQMAAEMGIGKSTVAGSVSLKVFRAVSWIAGTILIKLERKAYAVKA